MKHIVFDFDGVFIANSSYLAGFIARIIPFCSLQRAKKIVVQAGMHNSTYNGLSGRIRKYGSRLFLRYLQSYLEHKHTDYVLQVKNDLLYLIEKLDLDAYLLTSNYRAIVDVCIEDRVSLFTDIITFDDVGNKTEGIARLSEVYGFSPSECIFITDTVGDILEFKKHVDESHIIAVDWGFHNRQLLEQYISHESIASTVLDVEKLLTKLM